MDLGLLEHEQTTDSFEADHHRQPGTGAIQFAATFTDGVKSHDEAREVFRQLFEILTEPVN